MAMATDMEQYTCATATATKNVASDSGATCNGTRERGRSTQPARDRPNQLAMDRSNQSEVSSPISQQGNQTAGIERAKSANK